MRAGHIDGSELAMLVSAEHHVAIVVVDLIERDDAKQLAALIGQCS